MLIRALLIGMILLPVAACENKNHSVKESVEDAGHEAGQAVERAGDKIKDATN